MSVNKSDTIRNAALDAEWSEIGATPKLEFRTGAKPAALTDARSGTVVATLTLPATPMSAAAGGSKSKSGTWSGTASAAGTIGYWTLYKTDGSTRCLQGTAGGPGSGADMIIDNPILALNQLLTVQSFTQTAGNA